ncbi:MAG TPA: Hsp70 family protein [Polyangiaceae bacterium]|nr:Hsp70 family protein [Polyangiaceae bacterium]
MSSPRPAYVGIDLGTTNSAAAVFDGERLELVRNAQGATITPSVVRVDARGNVTVGERARRMLDQDTENVRTEFKRLMGTAHTLAFAASGLRKKPEDLSAEVLRALRNDVLAQIGFLPERAVISVPALFELPQTAATSDAARLAGFERVEMIQEPVASAIAAGWKAEESVGPWLVYDLGGGTFDASLLETQDGLLRIVGHDGDNFLGGRDFDAMVVDWAVERIAEHTGVKIARENPAHATALRRLRQAAEEAKIELTRAREAEILVSGLAVGDRSVDVALTLDRPTLEKLVEPLVTRSIAVCVRLLATHGIEIRKGALARVVLVGGPTAMPMLRERVGDLLAAPFGEGLDPMTLVAQGAALYAANAGLSARSEAKTAQGAAGPKVWLQYPAMSSDTSPFVIGKLVDPADKARVASVVLRRKDGGWTSAPEAVDKDGTFAVMTNLAPRRPNAFVIEGRGADGTSPVPLSPPEFTIVHGVTIGDPPLARTVGVALASDQVRVFFERGSPLPMRRTFTLRTVEALSPMDTEGALRVPIVQGEFAFAHLCRVVGSLEIRARDLSSSLAADSPIEVTIELDRGGRLVANARVAQTSQLFDQVIHLVAGVVPVAELGPRLAETVRRVQTLRARAFQRGVRGAIERLASADDLVAQGARDEEAARGGDMDAAEKVRRVLLDLEALLADAEAALAWPDLDARVREEVARATIWVGQYGTPEERKVLSERITAIDKARSAQNPQEVERQRSFIRGLNSMAYLRSPGAWEHELDYAASKIPKTTDPRNATQLVDEGRAAAARRDPAALERAVRAIWRLLPETEEDRALGHGSGVR